MRHDIAIVGGGPAGLSFARAIADTGLNIAVLEQRPVGELADPPFDGREIAITQLTARLMREYGQWQHIDPNEIAPMRRARVLNGPSPFAMVVEPGSAQSELGFLIPNHLIRRAAYETVKNAANVSITGNRRVTSIRAGAGETELGFADGSTLHARLVIAADSRFSEMRRAMGIPADMHDFGRTMLVFRMEIEKAHEFTAWEWFGYGQTLAMLPVNGNQASVVLTLTHREIDALLKLDDEAFSRDMERRFDHRLGRMRVVSTRHPYPLVSVYAERFIGPRFACIGDAAVGMHPVTAHGFNFGLRGVHTLAKKLRAAIARGEDIASPSALEEFEREHRTATKPLYLTTNAIARVYVDESTPARLVRNLALRAGQGFSPFRQMLGAALSDASETPPVLARIAGAAAAALRPRNRAGMIGRDNQPGS